MLCTSSEVLRKEYLRHRYFLSKAQFWELQNPWALLTTLLPVKEKSGDLGRIKEAKGGSNHYPVCYALGSREGNTKAGSY